MSAKQITPVAAGFEALKQTNEHNAEYWRARDLQPLLGYTQWRRFEQAIERAMEAIVEAFSSMQDDLDKERKVIMKQWAKRQEQIERVMGATVGIMGTCRRLRGWSCRPWKPRLRTIGRRPNDGNRHWQQQQ